MTFRTFLLFEVIRLFRPAHLEADGDRPVALLAEWLALWTLHGVLDDRVRSRALELARSKMPILRPALEGE